jgi:tetratricopeptide (TPR) repeat protein
MLRPSPPQDSPTKVGGVDRTVLARHYVMAKWLMRYFSPRAPRELTFLSPEPGGAIPGASGPAVFFGRPPCDLYDELDLVGAFVPRRADESGERVLLRIRDSLVGLTGLQGAPVDRLLGAAVTGDPTGCDGSVAKGAVGHVKESWLEAVALSLGGADPEQIEKALASDQSASNGPLLLLRAHLAALRGDREKAATLLTEVNGKSSTVADLYVAAGLAFRMKQVPLASGLLEKIVSLEPRQAGAHLVLAALAESVGNLQRARGSYTRAIEAKPEDPLLLASAHVRRALLDQKMDVPPGGVDGDLKAAEELDPVVPGLALARARSAFKRSEFREALDLWQRLLVVDGPSEESVIGLARCYEELKDQNTSRFGVFFLTLLTEQRVVPAGILAKRVDETLANLKERLRPRPIYEYESR